MKVKKTPWSKRSYYVYTYYDNNGNRKTEYIIEGKNGVTKEHIAKLHSLDDKEIKNNIKNFNAPMLEKTKQQIKEWERVHPNEENPYKFRLYNVSLDDMDDKSSEMEYIQSTENDEVPLEVERLREVIERLSEFDRKIYELVVIEKMSETEVSKILFVSVATVSRHKKYILEFIKKHF